MSRIIHSSYWGTFSRVLAENFEAWQTVELNLTPVNGLCGDWEKEVLPIVIRKHCTTRSPKDEVMRRLPDVWWTILGDKLGRELRHRLLTEDFLPLIDWRRYSVARPGGGGVPLDECRFLEIANR